MPLSGSGGAKMRREGLRRGVLRQTPAGRGVAYCRRRLQSCSPRASGSSASLGRTSRTPLPGNHSADTSAISKPHLADYYSTRPRTAPTRRKWRYLQFTRSPVNDSFGRNRDPPGITLIGMRSFSTGWIREGLTNQNSAVIVLVGLITTKKGTCCRQFAFSSQMITKIGDAKSVCCSRARPGWQVICEASDGSAAVQKAEELKPDLVFRWM